MRRIINLIIFILILVLSFFIDKTLALWISSSESGIFHLIVKIISSYFVIVAALLISAYFVIRDKQNWKRYLLAILLPFIVGILIKLVYHRLRPYDALNFVPFAKDFWWSFPSFHTILAFAIALNIGILYGKRFALFVVFALIVGLSRLLLDVHYLSDIIAGMFLAYLFFVIVHYGKKDKNAGKTGKGRERQNKSSHKTSHKIHKSNSVREKKIKR